MRLRLVITTDGRPDVLDRALASYDQHVRPRPVETVVVDDSGDPDYFRYLDDLLSTRMGVYGGRAKLHPHPERLGFCETVADAWRFAGEVGGVCPHCEKGREDWSNGVWGETCPRCGTPSVPPPPPDWVFWLEDDFVFTRTVPLVDLGFVLERQMQLAQMSLLRQPVSEAEVAAGGLLNIDPERFERRGSGTSTWIEHRAYWTTNPSLFRRSFVAEAPAWPVVDRCEGVFRFDLLEQREGTTFGIWGDGSPWVAHDAERVGAGY
jgi:hypothetical protein